jgi:hypothetical protein
MSLLGITDRVKVEVRKLDPRTNALTWTNPDYLEALIAFNDPAVCGPYDLEEVAAHEVFHLPFADFKTEAGTQARSTEERAVERFSRAFVALWRGTPAVARVSLAPTLRAIIASSPRARHRIAAKRREGMEQLMDLLMKAGAASEREDVPEEVRALLRELAAAAVTGEAPAGGEAGDAPPAAEAEPKPEDEAPPPAMRAALSAKARKALEDAERDAEETAEIAKKRKALEVNSCRQALFDSAPDVFGGSRAKRRGIYKSAPIEEIERFIEAQRGEAQPPAGDSKARKAPDAVGNEPLPGGAARGAFPKNDGGLVVRGGGN